MQRDHYPRLGLSVTSSNISPGIVLYKHETYAVTRLHSKAAEDHKNDRENKKRSKDCLDFLPDVEV